ncbi:hypothetical protein EXIGLDRAFT_699391 [Exidia glandulosa HHB12029]|uniref:F-box domain-containing protein n=1 Tax=Exidia glandulosa HHB12029 TaxID=1314781 RepID=A0A165DWY5_EXIGL|nr:hypothetical protein EXIGLDRAFT_699391 [Exidia glandulosa HHB12029]
MSTNTLAADTTLLLPAELLLAVFAHLPLASRITATHVCWRWRDAALAAPALLWSQIVSKGSRPGALEAQLARAGNVKIDLQLVVPEHGYEIMVAAAAEHLHKVRSLSYSASIDGYFASRRIAGWKECVVGLLSCPVPTLEVLHIGLLYDQLPTPLFSGQCPKLRHVSLRSTSFKTPYVVVPSVTLLEYSSYTLDRGKLRAIASMFTSTTALRLHYASHHDLLTTDTSMLDLFPSLEYLSVQLTGTRDSVRSSKILFELLRHKDIRTIEIHSQVLSKRDDDFMLLVGTLVDALQTPQQLTFASVGDFCTVAVRLTDSRGFSRMLRSYPCNSLLIEPVLSHITTLEVTEIDAIPNFVGVRLPFLHTLTVYLLFPVSHTVDDIAELSIFLPAPRQPQAIDCPMLRRLRLSTLVSKDICPSYGGIPTLSPEMICDFVQQCLRTSRPLLDVLSFHGVVILQHVPENVAAMLLLAQDVQFHPAPSDLFDIMDSPFDLYDQWD